MERNERHIALSITEGRTVRDLFHNGLLDFLNDAGFSVTVLTEAVTVPFFIEQWQRPGVDFAPLLPIRNTRMRAYGHRVRRRVTKTGNRALLNFWKEQEQKRLFPPPQQYLELFRSKNTSLVFITHAQLRDEIELLSAAYCLGIPTLGLARSWDNILKGLISRPDYLGVWNEINFQEAIDLENYSAEQLSLVGAPQFDVYFKSDTLWSREKFAAHFNLDPKRPIIFFGSKGQFASAEIDETVWMDILISMLDREELPGKPQILCRLHPHSRIEHFLRFAQHPDVRLSHVERHYPILGWYMNRDDMVLMANMFKHADVVINPSSTLTLEAAIFDRPTIVVMFSPYQPEKASHYFQTMQLKRHFGRIANLGLVPVLHNLEEFAPTIKRALQQPSEYKEQRARLVREYVHFNDGESTKRLAELAVLLATRKLAP